VVEDTERRLAPLVVGSNLAWWEANVDAGPETERRRVDADLALTDLLGEPELLRTVEQARTEATEPLVRRQLDLLCHWLLPNQVPDSLRRRIIELEASVESAYATHRGVVRGRELDDNALKRVLRTSESSEERRAAWEASKTVGALVADRVCELARLRNTAATSLGFRDWFALAVATSEMDEQRLFATLAETEQVTREPFARWKAEVDGRLAERYGVPVAELRPWHYDDPFFQEVPTAGGVQLDPVFAGRDVVTLAGQTFDALGLETAPIVARSDLFPRGGKSQHAFCMDVDRAGDIRVLANVVHDRYWAETMLHELGHAVYDAGFDRALPWLLRDTHLTVTEGVAILMGRLASDAEWLGEVAGMGADAVAMSAALRRFQSADLLVFTRWVLVMTNFERALYADPESDLDAIWWELVRRYQLVSPPPDRRAPDWAAKIHIACSPVYYHTYLYGNLVASQLNAMLVREAGGLVGRPEAGRMLVDRVFAPGESLRWDRLIAEATGKPLSARAYAADIAAGL